MISTRFNSWKSESSSSAATKFLLFLLSPVLGLLSTLRSLNTKSSHIIIYLFCVSFGVAFTVSNVRTEGSIDGITYRAEFEEMQDESASAFKYDFERYLTFSDGEQDFYFTSLAFFVSRFSSNYHVFFLFVALIFAFFQLRTLRFFTSHENFSNSLFCLILFFLFTWNQIFNINGLRFWTAAWIAVYACFQLMVNNNRWYIFLAILTPFVHGSYFLFLFVLLIYYLFGKFEKPWIALFLLSFVTSTVALEFTRDISAYLPDIFSRKVDFYTDSQYIIERSTGSGYWFVDKFFSTLSLIYINAMTIFLIFKNDLGKNADRNLLRFLIILMTFSNIFMPVPSVGKRFIELAYPIIAYLWLSYFSDKKYTWIIYLLPFVWFMKLYHMLVLNLSVLDMSFFITSPIYQLLDKIVF